MKPIRVLVVDDSAIVRNKLSTELNRYPDIQVVGTAMNPYIARDKIVELDPDVITLDVEMPRMDGITFLKKLMKFYPKPVIIISSLTKKGSEIALEAINAGAVEVMCKPGGSYSVGTMSEQLAHVIRAADAANMKVKKEVRPVMQTPPAFATINTSAPPAAGSLRIGSEYHPQSLIVIGASTGGTEALTTVLKSIPADAPPILIVQHMPEHFTLAFANRVNMLCNIYVKEAANGDLAEPGKALIAPGNFHMVLRSAGGRLSVETKDGPKVHHQRPAVDVLFQSVAKANLRHVTAAILTGMGKDGAAGMKKLRDQGAHTIAQNEQTCVVYGMPKEAVALGAAEKILPLEQIAAQLLNFAKS